MRGDEGSEPTTASTDHLEGVQAAAQGGPRQGLVVSPLIEESEEREGEGSYSFQGRMPRRGEGLWEMQRDRRWGCTGQPWGSLHHQRRSALGLWFPGGCTALPSSTGLLALVHPVRSVVLGFPWCPSSTCSIKPQRSALGWGALSPRLLRLHTPC